MCMVAHLSKVTPKPLSFPLKVTLKNISGGTDILLFPEAAIYKLLTSYACFVPSLTQQSILQSSQLFLSQSACSSFPLLACRRAINSDAGCERRQPQNKQIKVIISVYLQVILRVLRIT